MLAKIAFVGQNSKQMGGCFPRRTFQTLFLSLLFLLPTEGQEVLVPQSIEATELPSPDPVFPHTTRPGLSERAIPLLPEREAPQTLPDLYRLTRPFSASVFSNLPGSYLPPIDPSTFRPVTAYEPPIALRPRIYRKGLLNFYPWVGLSRTYDSNVNLAETEPEADFYVSPRAGIEMQLGSPDSIYEPYDTILALNASYEAWGDIFYEHTDWSAFNQRLELRGRIGRTSGIFRPFLSFSDITGTDVLTRELFNRTRRIRVLPGLRNEFQLTSVIGWNQTFSSFHFHHTDPLYINLDSWRTQQELTYRLTPDLRLLAWGEYRRSNPSRGSSAEEVFFGLGWAGKPDPRLYTEIRFGWDQISHTRPPVIGKRRNLSGFRFNGYTTFQWSQRTALTFRYDRDYVFDEMAEDDNFVSTLLQLKAEFWMGEQWFLTPYFGVSIDDHETSRNCFLNLRPEIELSYAFPDDKRSNESRIYLKFGYIHSQTLHGYNRTIEAYRITTGLLYQF